MLNPLFVNFPKHEFFAISNTFMWTIPTHRYGIFGKVNRTGILSKIFKKKTVIAGLAETVGNEIGYAILEQWKNPGTTTTIMAVHNSIENTKDRGFSLTVDIG
jgi:hypothetical protein